jgi:3-oxoacyl-[acyl-carrier protein] reductase
MDANNLHGKIALVTGASRGIGQAILQTLAARGATVVGTATTAEGALHISQGLAKMGSQGKGIALDLRDVDGVATAVAAVVEQYGAPTILVNNAGLTHDNLLLRMKEEEWLDLLTVNLTAVFRLSKLCVKHMLKQRCGRIVSLGSLVGSTGNPGQTNYSATKAGIAGFSRSLAAEVGSRGITVNVVAPGFIETDMTKELPAQQVEHFLAQTPLGRLGHVDEVAALVGFLVSDAAGFITGQTIHINGGIYMT